MEENKMQDQINDINNKLDIILEEIELQRKHRREMEDLKDDLMRVGKDVYQTTVEELEEVADHIQTGDMLHLGKKLLRNVNNISGMFDQLESMNDLLKDLAPISREIAIDFMAKLDEFDRKGYFEFMREINRAMDNVVESFTVEDVRALGDNVVTILNTVKNLTQPDMLQALDNGLSVYKKLDIEVDEKISYFTLIKRMNTPEMRRGIAFAIRFLKSMAEKPAHKKISETSEVKNNQSN
ncbi:MAG: DUF1641 domain-containing protein [Melioribacteraceae bacterium]|nr:DUF1641 domain-containing protein [Melioribacteraceae bacterium]